MKTKTSSGLLLFFVVMLLVVLISARAPLDADMWWHIRSGEATIQAGKPLLVDIFSFTRAGMDWTNHSWLAQVFLALAFKGGGFTGLAIYTSILAVLAMGIIYRLVEGPPLLKAFLVILASAAGALVWTPRPQMFSLALFSGLLLLLETYRRERRAPLWLIPVMFAVWSNLHGGFPIGLALLAIFVFSEVVSRALFFAVDESLSWREIGKLALWSLSALPAVLLNPNGIKTWLIPFQTVGVMALQNLIQEWASPDFHNPAEQLILVLFFLLFIAGSLSGKRLRVGDIFVPLAFAYMTFLARRNLAAFAMAAAPAASRAILAAWQSWRVRITPESWIGRILGSDFLTGISSSNRELPPATARVVNLAITAFLAAVAFGRLGVQSLPQVVENRIQIDYPARGVEFIHQNRLEERLFSEYNWGGYLIYSSPETPVFVDGRTDLFGDEIIGEWRKVVLGEPGWEAILEKWDVHLVLLQPNRPILQLMASKGWQVKFRDAKSVLMTNR